MLRNGVAELEQRAASNPDDVATKLKLAVRYDGIAIAQASSKNYADAQQTLRAALAIRRPIASAGGTTASAKPMLEAVARELWSFSVCEALSGDAEHGREDMNDSIKFWRDAAAIDPTDAAAEANVALGLFWLANGDPANAHTLLTEALAIAEKMQREGRLAANQTEWPNVFRTELAKHP